MNQKDLDALMAGLTPQLKTLLQESVDKSLNAETLKALITDQMKELGMEETNENVVALQKAVKELTEKLQTAD